jgi:hypothetical protein
MRTVAGITEEIRWVVFAHRDVFIWRFSLCKTRGWTWLEEKFLFQFLKSQESSARRFPWSGTGCCRNPYAFRPETFSISQGRSNRRSIFEGQGTASGIDSLTAVPIGNNWIFFRRDCPRYKSPYIERTGAPRRASVRYPGKEPRGRISRSIWTTTLPRLPFEESLEKISCVAGEVGSEGNRRHPVRYRGVGEKEEPQVAIIG